MSYATGPFSDPRPPDEQSDDDRDAVTVTARRMFLAEPGWRIGVKTGSDREFCYMMMPGQDFYHRLLDGEVFLHRHEEKLCLACATRRGLLLSEPKRLREAIIALPVHAESIPLELGWRDAEHS
jgi:hypothetical protein